jgi:hypothetical protein
MKIPEKLYLIASSGEGRKIIDAWASAAARTSLESGIYITIKVAYRTRGYIDSIVFIVDDHEFEGLDDLKKCLLLKVFL